jgi:hypothetical protein
MMEWKYKRGYVDFILLKPCVILCPTNCTKCITIIISNFNYTIKISHDYVVDIAIRNELCGPDFETRFGRDFLYSSRSVPKSYPASCKIAPVVLHRGKYGWVVELAIHSF